MDFQKISADDGYAIKTLSAVAIEIIKEHYDSIIGSVMNDYMIQMFQSVPAITQQLQTGCQYYFVKENGTILGFLAYYLRGRESLYLSKFYLYKHYRGNGYSRQMLNFLIQTAEDNGLKAIELNVNRNNPAIQVYQKLGFITIREEDSAIGNGFIMRDYVLRLDTAETGFAVYS
ncbi:MAG: GNAT family N-acetyltransferase [Oxalobacter sp.]